MPETRMRSLAKTISWRISATTITFIISYIFTSSVTISGGIACVEFIAKMIWYYIHERVWNLIKWGVNKNKYTKY